MAPVFVFSNLHSSYRDSFLKAASGCDGAVIVQIDKIEVSYFPSVCLCSLSFGLPQALCLSTDFFLTWQAAAIERKKVTMHSVSYLFFVFLEIHQKLPKLVNLQLTRKGLKSSRVRIRISCHQSLSSLVERQQLTFKCYSYPSYSSSLVSVGW